MNAIFHGRSSANNGLLNRFKPTLLCRRYVYDTFILADLTVAEIDMGLIIHDPWTCPYKTGHQLPVKLVLPPSA